MYSERTSGTSSSRARYTLTWLDMQSDGPTSPHRSRWVVRHVGVENYGRALLHGEGVKRSRALKLSGQGLFFQ